MINTAVRTAEKKIQQEHSINSTKAKKVQQEHNNQNSGNTASPTQHQTTRDTALNATPSKQPLQTKKKQQENIASSSAHSTAGEQHHQHSTTAAAARTTAPPSLPTSSKRGRPS